MKRVLMVVVLAIVASACTAPAAPSVQGEAVALVVSGGDTPKSYTVAQLKALAQVEAQFKDVTYIGVSMGELLKSAGFKPEEVRSVRAVASDAFTATYDATQIMRSDLIVAHGTTGGPLSKDDGTLRTVLPGAEGKLNIRSLVELQVTK